MIKIIIMIKKKIIMKKMKIMIIITIKMMKKKMKKLNLISQIQNIPKEFKITLKNWIKKVICF